MTPRYRQLLKVLGAAALIVAALQILAFCRYLDRVEDDWLGIALYLIGIVAFVLVAAVFFAQSREVS